MLIQLIYIYSPALSIHTCGGAYPTQTFHHIKVLNSSPSPLSKSPSTCASSLWASAARGRLAGVRWDVFLVFGVHIMPILITPTGILRTAMSNIMPQIRVSKIEGRYSCVGVIVTMAASLRSAILTERVH
ncbi:hypothetical protein F5148DRAFT_1229229 [Russula earlei]|uniref:Uncharacterized protein n=1 Tax=Russula earlei TaxID=71964 RepID=A0ACC0U0U9_9AGAM|nr:hypothetical protein F5148DRAFT_1229229 [Russula earlei]